MFNVALRMIETLTYVFSTAQPFALQQQEKWLWYHQNIPDSKQLQARNRTAAMFVYHTCATAKDGHGGRGATSPWPLQMPKGRRQYVFPPPPTKKKHCMDLLKSRQQAFWGLKVPKGPPFQTSSHHNILSLSGANRELGMHPLKPRIDLLRHYLDCVRSSMDSLWKRMRILSLN